MLIRILSSDWSISIQVPSKLKKNRMHFYSIQVHSSFLIQVSCMVYTIKKLEFKKLEWRFGCKTCIVYTGLSLASCIPGLARYTRCKFCIQVSIQENLNSSLCIHDARNFDEYTQVLAGDTTNKMAFLGGEEGAALCVALLCTIVLRRRLSSKKRSTWARKWLRRQRWGVFL